MSTAPCVFVAHADHTACTVHDVQAEPPWPDAMGEVVCPVWEDADWRLVHGVGDG